MKREYKEVRIFQNDFLESFTHVDPIIPLILWLPVAISFIYLGVTNHGLSYIETISLGVSALFAWTALEYFLHRFAFHYPAKSKIGKRLIFMIHGLHHEEPGIPTRLLMPPLPALVIVVLFYYGLSLVLPFEYLFCFMGFFLLGYLAYDYTHYAIHHFPLKSKLGKYIKKHHIMHHNVCPDAKFGVSNPLWDFIMNTVEKRKTND